MSEVLAIEREYFTGVIPEVAKRFGVTRNIVSAIWTDQRERDGLSPRNIDTTRFVVIEGARTIDLRKTKTPA